MKKLFFSLQGVTLRLCNLLFLPIFFTILSNPLFAKNSLNTPLMIKGRIESYELEKIPPFKVYFEGIETVSNAEGFFTIPLDNKPKSDTYSLLICKNFKPKFDTINTIKHLTIKPKKYKFYTFEKSTLQNVQEKINSMNEKLKPLKLQQKLINRQIEVKGITFHKGIAFHEGKTTADSSKNILKSLKKRKNAIDTKIKNLNKKIVLFTKRYKKLQAETPQNPAGDFWIITQKKFNVPPTDKKGRAIIPENCVIVSMNPKIVSSVKNWNFAINKNFVAFPQIILKKNIETRNIRGHQSITRSSVKSELISWDKKVFHETRNEKYKKENDRSNVKISLIS